MRIYYVKLCIFKNTLLFEGEPRLERVTKVLGSQPIKRKQKKSWTLYLSHSLLGLRFFISGCYLYLRIVTKKKTCSKQRSPCVNLLILNYKILGINVLHTTMHEQVRQQRQQTKPCVCCKHFSDKAYFNSRLWVKFVLPFSR